MRTSASAFAAQLTEDLHASLPRCAVARRLPGGLWGEGCGKLGGRAQASCRNGHVRIGYVCPDHVKAGSPHRCGACWSRNQETVPVTVITEVA